MIKCDLGKQIVITGHAVQIAAELECLARDVIIALCNSFGKEYGMELYNRVIRMSEMSETERDQFCEEELQLAKVERPELYSKSKEYTDMLMKMMFGGTSSPGSVEEE